MGETRLTRFVERVRFFAAIVWRPATGPSRDEPPMSGFQVFRHYRIGIRTAWEVAGIFHGQGETGGETR